MSDRLDQPRRSAVGPDLQPTLDELSVPGRASFKVPHAPADALAGIPVEQLRQRPAALPDIDEPTVIRHFVRLSHLNYSVDSGFYPLGSCTMKYNPKVNEWAARLPGFADLHPLVPDALAQGTLELLWRLQEQLGEIGGFPAVSLQPAAGAHGELSGILVIRAWHESRGDHARDEVIVPDSSHGTNPATASMAGYPHRHDPLGSGRRGGPGRPARRAGAADGRGHAHEPVHAGPLRAARRRGPRGHPCRRCAGLHGRRQHERDPGPLPARCRRLRRHALQPAQDVLDAARRWRAGRRTHRRGRPPGALPAGAPRVREADGTFRLERPGERPDVHRPGPRLPGQPWASSCVPTPTSGARRHRPAPGQR